MGCGTEISGIERGAVEAEIDEKFWEGKGGFGGKGVLRPWRPEGGTGICSKRQKWWVGMCSSVCRGLRLGK